MSIEAPTDPYEEEEYTGDGPYDDEEWLAQQRKDVGEVEWCHHVG